MSSDDTKFLPRRLAGSQFPVVYGDPLANHTALSRIRWLFVVARNTRVKPSPQVGRVACAGPHAHLAAVADPLVRQKLIDAGAEPLQSSPQEMADHIRKEAAKWAEVIRTANIQLD